MSIKRLVASILLACMTFTMVACSSSSTTTSTTTTTTTTVDTEVETTDDNPYGLKYDGMYSLSDEPITLTTFVHWQDTMVLTPSMEIPIEMGNFTNIYLEGVAPEYLSDSTQAFNLMITEAVLPDMIAGDIVDINKYAAEGAFIPLNDLIDEYAPDIKAVFELYPEAEAAVTTADGTIYSIPFVYEETVSQAWFIRQDWLDILDLEVPTTFDELVDVMYAFRDGDPNGNGIADEIPMFRRRGSDDCKLSGFLQLFGVSAFWHTTDDGTVQYGLYTEDFKDAMIGISEWYDEGLIYAETFTTDNSTRALLWGGDNGGMTFDWIPSTSAYNTTIAEYVPDFALVPMAPSDINGTQWTAFSRYRAEEYGWGISCDNQYPVESMKFMNFLFTDKGRDINTYGIEGYHFEYNEDGDPIYTDLMFNDESTTVGMITTAGGSLQPMAYLHDATYEYQVMDYQGEVATEMYSEFVGTYLPLLPMLSMTDEESDFISSVFPTCLAYMLEKCETWTYDGSRIEAEFDEYMETLKQMRMDEVVEIYQTAYDRMMDSIA